MTIIRSDGKIRTQVGIEQLASESKFSDLGQWMLGKEELNDKGKGARRVLDNSRGGRRSGIV